MSQWLLPALFSIGPWPTMPDMKTNVTQSDLAATRQLIDTCFSVRSQRDAFPQAFNLGVLAPSIVKPGLMKQAANDE